jgi:hypothetical protein
MLFVYSTRLVKNFVLRNSFRGLYLFCDADMQNVSKEARAHAEQFLAQGWKRSARDFLTTKEEIWQRNEVVIRSVLGDPL